MDRLIIWVREGTILGQASFKSLAEIPFRPVALWIRREHTKR